MTLGVGWLFLSFLLKLAEMFAGFRIMDLIISHHSYEEPYRQKTWDYRFLGFLPSSKCSLFRSAISSSYLMP